jgi:tricorn protease-like protein
MEEIRSEATYALSDLEVRILDFERQWWRYAGAKEIGIKEQFDLSTREYYELLNNLIDRDDALDASPLLIKRLRRLREARLARRIS